MKGYEIALIPNNLALKINLYPNFAKIQTIIKGLNNYG